MNEVISQLQEASQNPYQDLPEKNSFKAIGFDGEKPRLGWARELDLEKLKAALLAIKPVLAQKEHFIFAGIGGSINGIKAQDLPKTIYALSSIHPDAFREIEKLGLDWQKTAVIAISKSASTVETITIVKTLQKMAKGKLGALVWLTDPAGFEKVEERFPQSFVFTIQPDKKDDIGGRFSSPKTLIFLLPLFLAFGFDWEKISKFCQSLNEAEPDLLRQAYKKAEELKNCCGWFAIKQDFVRPDFYTWAVQLFNESLGSKKEDVRAKTIFSAQPPEGFCPIELPGQKDNLTLAKNMLFLQYFVAFFAFFKQLNFVNQPFVEKYKSKMRQLQESSLKPPAAVSMADLAGMIKEKAAAAKFIEIVAYAPLQEKLQKLQSRLQAEFPSQPVLLFEGSDWNHHSYQGAFSDQHTFYLLIFCSASDSFLAENLEVMQTIAEATHQTLADKSIYRRLQEC